MFDCRTGIFRMTGLLCSFADFRLTERTEPGIMNDLHTPQISLFSEHEEPQSYEVYVYGTDDLNEQNKDSFCVALCLYLDRDQYKPENACKTDGNCSIYALTVSFG